MKKRKISPVVFLMLLSFAGFIAGVLFLSLRRENWILQQELMNQDFMDKIEKVKVDRAAYFFGCLLYRFKSFFLLFLLAFSTVNVISNVLFFSLYGFFAGVMMELLMMRYGIQGMWICLSAMLPHSVFYYWGFLQLGTWCLNMENEKTHHRVSKITKLKHIKDRKRLWLAFTFVFLGCFAESFLEIRKIFFLFWKV